MNSNTRTVVPVAGEFDLTSGKLTLNIQRPKTRRGRPCNDAARDVAVILAEAWARRKFGSQIKKELRLQDANADLPSDDRSLRRAVKAAKSRRMSLFVGNDQPGVLFVEKAGVVWFSDKAALINTDSGTIVSGPSWCWIPGKKEATWVIAKIHVPIGHQGKLLNAIIASIGGNRQAPQKGGALIPKIICP